MPAATRAPQRDGAHLVGVDRAADVGAGEQHPRGGHRPGRDGRDLPLRRRRAGAGAAGEALGQRPAPLPPRQDLRARAPQDGRPRPRGGHHRGDGAHAGQVRGRLHHRHGCLRAPRRGHRDQGQCPGRRVRVHGRVLNHQQAGEPSPLLLLPITTSWLMLSICPNCNFATIVLCICLRQNFASSRAVWII